MSDLSTANERDDSRREGRLRAAARRRGLAWSWPARSSTSTWTSLKIACRR